MQTASPNCSHAWQSGKTGTRFLRCLVGIRLKPGARPGEGRPHAWGASLEAGPLPWLQQPHVDREVPRDPIAHRLGQGLRGALVDEPR